MYCFGVFCRVCLEPKRNMSNLDSFCEGIHIGKMIFAVNKELLNLDRLLPDLICQPCKVELEISYKFSKKCNKSLRFLTDYVQKLNPQSEKGENYTSHLEYFGLGSNITSKNRNLYERNEYKIVRSYNQHNSRSLLFKIKRLGKRKNKRLLQSKSLSKISSNCMSDLSEFSLKDSCSEYSKPTVKLNDLQNVHELSKKDSFIYDKKYHIFETDNPSLNNSLSSGSSTPINNSSSLTNNPLSRSPVNDLNLDEIDEKSDVEIGETSLNNSVSEYNRIKEEILNNSLQSIIAELSDTQENDYIDIKPAQKLNIISHEIVPCHLKFNFDFIDNDGLDSDVLNKEIKEEKLDDEMEEFGTCELSLKNELLDIEEHDLPYTLEDNKFYKQELLGQKKVETEKEIDNKDNAIEDKIKIVEESKPVDKKIEQTEFQVDIKTNTPAEETIKTKEIKPLMPYPKRSFLNSRYCCKYCDTPCYSAIGLKTHIFKFHISKFNECKICYFTFRTRMELLQHVRIHRQQFRQQPNYKTQRDYDYNIFNNSSPTKNRRSYTCKYCKQVFWAQFEFGQHIRICTQSF